MLTLIFVCFSVIASDIILTAPDNIDVELSSGSTVNISCVSSGATRNLCECVAKSTYSGSYKQWVMYKLGVQQRYGNSTEFSGRESDRKVVSGCKKLAAADSSCFGTGPRSSCTCVAETTYSGSYKQWVIYQRGSKVSYGNSTEFKGSDSDKKVTRECRKNIKTMTSCYK